MKSRLSKTTVASIKTAANTTPPAVIKNRSLGNNEFLVLINLYLIANLIYLLSKNFDRKIASTNKPI